MENIEISVVKNLQAEWRSLIEPWCNFFRTEPICSPITAFRDPANEGKLVEMLQEKVECDPDCLCILAWDTKNEKAAGMVVTATEYRVLTPELEKTQQRTWANFNWDAETLTHIKNIDSFLGKMVEESNVTVKYGVDKALIIDQTSVCKEYTKRGLAHRMTELCIEEAQKRGYPIVMSESTSAFTRKNKTERFGFEVVMEFDFAECYGSYSVMSEEIRKVHNKAAVLVKRL